MFTNLRLRWRSLWKRRQLDRDLKDEIAFHLAMRQGSTRQFGNPTLIRENLREMWTFHILESLWHDLRYGVRMLWKSPAFTLVAILSLAIGIGANTAIFSLVDAILLKSLPVREPASLRLVLWAGEPRVPLNNSSGYTRKNEAGQLVHSSFSYSMYRMFAEQASQFSDLAGFARSQVTVVAGESHYANAFFVTGNMFNTLGVPPLAGREIAPSDDRADAEPVAVISYAYWERHFGLDRSAINRQITVNGRGLRIVGITPQSFRGLENGSGFDLCLPLSLVSGFGPKFYAIEKPTAWWVQIVGRLRAGVDDRQAKASLDLLMERASAPFASVPKKGEPWRAVLESGAAGVQLMREQASRPLLILAGAVALVLLIACANIANLLLARASARRREIAVRLTIGASRWRLIGQLLTESILLAGIGAGLGLLFAGPMARGILAMAAGNRPISIQVGLNDRTLLFTLIAGLFTALLFGLAPAIRATRVDLSPSLKDGSAGSLGRGPQFGLSRFLVIGQVALSTVLLAGAGLFVRTLANLSTIDPGFNAHQVLIFAADGSRSGYEGGKLAGLYERIRARVAAIPGVQAVTLSSVPLIADSEDNDDVTVPGYVPPAGKPASANTMLTSSRFHRILGIPMLLGRELEDGDGPNSRKVAIVNETFARTYMAGSSPIGRIFYFGGPQATRKPEDAFEVVGVCKDAKYDSLKHVVPPTAYLSFLQKPDWMREATFEIRTELPGSALANEIRKEVAGIDRNVPVADMRTQEEQIRQSLGLERLFAGLMGAFGLCASVLAAIGLYGLLAYTVTRRTPEIGIRLALGAERRSVQWLVLRDVLWMVAIGMAIGIPVALALTSLIRKTLFGVTPDDPISFAGAAVLMALAAIAAAWIPARRAARVDPIKALRYE